MHHDATPRPNIARSQRQHLSPLLSLEIIFGTMTAAGCDKSASISNWAITICDSSRARPTKKPRGHWALPKLLLSQALESTVKVHSGNFCREGTSTSSGSAVWARSQSAKLGRRNLGSSQEKNSFEWAGEIFSFSVKEWGMMIRVAFLAFTSKSTKSEAILIASCDPDFIVSNL